MSLSREKILEVAENLLLTQGLEALNVRVLMKEVGFSVGSFYSLFSSLDELVLAINYRTLKAFRLSLTGRLRQESLTCGRIVGRLIGCCYMEFFDKRRALWSLLFTIGTSKAFQVPFWYQQEVDAFFEEVSALLQPCLGHDPTRATLTLKVLWCGLHGIYTLAFNDKLTVANISDPLALCEHLFSSVILSEKIYFLTQNEQRSNSRSLPS